MSEPRFGYRNLIKTKKAGKIKAFFTLLVPTESMGTMEVMGVKVVEGKNGLFISLPSRAVETPEGTKYYNNVGFESKGKSDEANKELNENLLPLIALQLS